MIFKGLLAAAVGALAIASGHSAELSTSATSNSSPTSTTTTANTGSASPASYSQPAPVDSTPAKEVRYSQPLIENPAYDPNLYTTFVPQDAVQQYVSHYGGAYASAPSYFAQNGDPSFAMQTGYEGYLVPSLSSYQAPSNGNAFSSFAKMAPVGFGIVRSLFPVAGKIFLAVLAKLAIVTMSTLGVIVGGGLITSLLCTFTPICKLTFAGVPFLRLKDTAKELTKTLETELTQDRVKRAAELVRLALEKYSELQEGFASAEKEVPKAAEPVSVADKKDE